MMAGGGVCAPGAGGTMTGGTNRGYHTDMTASLFSVNRPFFARCLATMAVGSLGRDLRHQRRGYQRSDRHGGEAAGEKRAIHGKKR
jgi:chloramphenicol 3-O-phosphotransferase